jgi:hypothetical protein
MLRLGVMLRKSVAGSRLRMKIPAHATRGRDIPREQMNHDRWPSVSVQRHDMCYSWRDLY